MKKFFSRQYFVSSSLAVIASVVVVAGFVYAATTIGTNVSVDGNLVVSSSNATSTFAAGGLNIGSGQFVVQQTSGRVGVGTTSPSDMLTVGGVSIGVAGISIRGDNDFCNAYPCIRSGGGGSLNFASSFGQHITLQSDSGSNVGIGDTSADALLEISASGGASDLFMLSSNDANDGNRFIVKNSGNLGIGTTSPGTLLSVAGDAYLAGTGTTTLRLQTTTASRGTCLEMFDGAGVAYRIFVSTSGVLTVAAGSCK